MPTELPKFLCFKREDIRCFHQCYMCKDKERELALQATTAREMKMAKEQPLFLLVAYFNDGRIPHMERSNDTNILLKYGRNLLTKDSKAASFLIYKPMSRTQRAEFSTDMFD